MVPSSAPLSTLLMLTLATTTTTGAQDQVKLRDKLVMYCGINFTLNSINVPCFLKLFTHNDLAQTLSPIHSTASIERQGNDAEHIVFVYHTSEHQGIRQSK